MPNSTKRSVMVSFRMPLETYEKIQVALRSYANGNSSVSDYCKQVVVRYAHRHENGKISTLKD